MSNAAKPYELDKNPVLGTASTPCGTFKIIWKEVNEERVTPFLFHGKRAYCVGEIRDGDPVFQRVKKNRQVSMLSTFRKEILDAPEGAYAALFASFLAFVGGAS